MAAPVGYLKTEDQRLEKDPDQRVQEIIRLLFDTFLNIGTARQRLLWFLEHDLSLPVRTPRGELIWRRPNYGMVDRMLTQPAYGGAYAYGKTETVFCPPGPHPQTRTRRKPQAQWLTLIPGAHEGYIDWARFELIQQMITQNVTGKGQSGAPRHGPALLAGLLRCRRCGRKLVVRYTGANSDVLRYGCERGWLDNAAPRCIAFSGQAVDRAIGQALLRVVQPAAVEAAIQAGAHQAGQREQILDILRRDVQAARYAAQRAFKHYDAADPENRLVTDELERRWNQALQRVQDLENRLEAQTQEQAQTSVVSTEVFKTLAEDLEGLWLAPQTDPRLKKRIVRALIEEVWVDIDDQAHELCLILHWKGGVHTQLRLPRRRRGQSTQTSKEVVEAVRQLARLCSDQTIAGMLNRNGLRTGRGNWWTRERVTSLRSTHKIPCYCPQQRAAQGWMNLTEAAALLSVSSKTLRLAVERGELPAEHPLGNGPWIFHQQALSSQAAIELVQRVRSRKGSLAVPGNSQQEITFSST